MGRNIGISLLELVIVLEWRNSLSVYTCNPGEDTLYRYRYYLAHCSGTCVCVLHGGVLVYMCRKRAVLYNFYFKFSLDYLYTCLFFSEYNLQREKKHVSRVS